MISGLILVTLLGLVALMLLLGYRMMTLVRTEPMHMNPVGTGDASLPAYEPVQKISTAPHKVSSYGQHLRSGDRAKLLTHLHILAGLQERDCRVSGLNLTNAPELVQGYATAWLYGAACALCEPSLRHSEALRTMVAHIASRKTGGRQQQALNTLDTLTSNIILLACFRGGLKGAEFWLENQHVSPRHSLYEAITTNAFI